MYFRIAADRADLVEPEDVKAFSVHSDLTGEALGAAVEQAAIGSVLPDGEHVMVEVAAIRRLAGDMPAGWEDELAGMLAYAEQKGWTSADGSAVRAHVERQV
jgi:hypothetical protein